jgi:heme/copper-type cytochrome/quinol oxidase subunit 3
MLTAGFPSLARVVTRHNAVNRKPMRWKMLLLSALVAAVSGAGLTALVVASAEYFSPSSAASAGRVLAVLLLAAAVTSGVFAYRHTARRRALHGLLASALTAAVFVGCVYAYHLIFDGRQLRPNVYQRLLGD